MKVTIPTYHECFYEIHVCCLRGTEMSCRDIKTLLSGLLQSPEDSVPRPWAGPGNSGINHQNWASQVHRTQFSSPRAVIITANVVSSLPQPQGATLEPCFLLRSLHLSHEWLSKPSQALESLSQPPMTPFLGEPSRTSLTPPVLFVALSPCLWHTRLHSEAFSGHLSCPSLLFSSIPHLLFLPLEWSVKWTPSLTLLHHGRTKYALNLGEVTARGKTSNAHVAR